MMKENIIDFIENAPYTDKATVEVSEDEKIFRAFDGLLNLFEAKEFHSETIDVPASELNFDSYNVNREDLTMKQATDILNEKQFSILNILNMKSFQRVERIYTERNMSFGDELSKIGVSIDELKSEVKKYNKATRFKNLKSATIALFGFFTSCIVGASLVSLLPLAAMILTTFIILTPITIGIALFAYDYTNNKIENKNSNLFLHQFKIFDRLINKRISFIKEAKRKMGNKDVGQRKFVDFVSDNPKQEISYPITEKIEHESTILLEEIFQHEKTNSRTLKT